MAYIFVGFIALWSFFIEDAAYAETLTEALTQAYETNPTLAAAIASLKSTDEDAAKAAAAWLPSVEVQSSVQQDAISSTPANQPEQYYRREPHSVGLVVNQNIYQGGATAANQRQVQASIKAAEASFRKAEQKVLLDAITAYLSVLNAQATLRLSQKNEELLKHMLKQIKARFELGDVTLTDVAQVEARLAEATAQRIQAEGSLETARAQYEQNIGTLPGELAFPDYPTSIPKTMKESLDTALSQSPELINALFVERAAQEDVDVKKAGLLPKVNLEVNLKRDEDRGRFKRRDYSGVAKVSLSVPLDWSGGVQSSIRQSRQVAVQKRLESRVVRRAVESSVTQAFESLKVAEAQVKQFEAQVSSTALALKGVRLEESVGQRTVIDILNAEKENYDAEKSLVNARIQYLLSHYQLLSVIGELRVNILGLPVQAYNPETYLAKAEQAPYGTSIGPEAEEEASSSEEKAN